MSASTEIKSSARSPQPLEKAHSGFGSSFIDRHYKVGFLSMLGLSLVSSIIPFLFLLAYSGMGYGLKLTAYSQHYEEDNPIETLVTLIATVVMHLFDSQYWPGPIRAIAWFSIFIAACITLCLMVALVPYGPICVFSMIVPLSIFGIRKLFFPNIPSSVLVNMHYKVFVYMAIIILVSFFYWCSINGNMWDSETNAEFSQKAGCAVDFTNMEECENYYTEGIPCFFDKYYEVVTFSYSCNARCLDVYQSCQEAFIIWSFPNLAALSLIVMGFIAKLLNPNDLNENQHVSLVAKFCSVFLFLFWIFASLAGAGEGLSSSLIAFAISMFIGSAIVFSVVFWTSLIANGGEDIVNEIDEKIEGITKKVEGYINLVRGMVVLVFSPFIAVYLLLSVLNQLIRRSFTRHCFRERMTEAEYEHDGYFTLAVDLQIKDFLSWDHAKVYSYSIYCGIGYVILSVIVTKFTTVFLSGLIEFTVGMNMILVTGIVVVVGLILFMLPPIPGMPVYLTGGIVLVSVGRETLGVWVSIMYACAVSLILKIFACACQQQLIGAKLGGNLRVRQMVAINSEGIRAMRVILQEPGFTVKKISVLVGGPDWPVSVLCGILGIDLLQVLIGTLPVFVLIVPTVLCGSFAYMSSVKDDDGVDLYPWAGTLGAVASAVAAGTLLYFNLCAANAVRSTLENDKDKIDAIKMDETVLEADAIAEKKNAYYNRVTIWRKIPFIMKSTLILALVTMMGCIYMLVFFNSLCFREYDLMYTVRENLGGNWSNIMLPLGRIALLLFSISCILLYSFESWAMTEADNMEKNNSGMTADLASTGVIV